LFRLKRKLNIAVKLYRNNINYDNHNTAIILITITMVVQTSTAMRVLPYGACLRILHTECTCVTLRLRKHRLRLLRRRKRWRRYLCAPGRLLAARRVRLTLFFLGPRGRFKFESTVARTASVFSRTTPRVHPIVVTRLTLYTRSS
jgi:hypothetical protein